jgi:hypothetical protein
VTIAVSLPVLEFSIAISLAWVCILFSIPITAGPHFLESVFSAEYAKFHGTHIGIKSFQGKINLFRNPMESGIPTVIPEGRKDP